MAQRILVNQLDFTQSTLSLAEPSALSVGQARMKIESFALTSNNVTYAASGFSIGYWKLFPSGLEGQGLVPVWGMAKVIESRNAALSEGQRFYGFYPMSDELIVEPQTLYEDAFRDQSSHRADLPLVYNIYVSVHGGTVEDDYLRSLLQPLLATSFLLFDWLDDNNWFGAKQIVIGSASSKTGLGLCKFLAEAETRPYRIVGLTSKSNRGFVEGLGACDEVLSYDEISRIAQVPTVYVDMAGNADVKAQLHNHLADQLKHSAAVGISHWDKFATPENLPGPKPVFFFAPAQIAKRREEWGAGIIEKQITAAWKRIAADADNWLELRVHNGLGAAQQVFCDLANWRANPRDGHVIRL